MEKKLKLSSNRMIGGVVAGIAEYFGWNTTVLRVVVAVLAIITQVLPAAIVYLVLWLILKNS